MPLGEIFYSFVYMNVGNNLTFSIPARIYRYENREIEYKICKLSLFTL